MSYRKNDEHHISEFKYETHSRDAAWKMCAA